MTQPSKWWESFYDSLLADILLETKNPKEIDSTVEFLTTFCGLGPGQRIFDQCCGTGRLSIPLAERGYQVVGIDLIENYIKSAKNKAINQGLIDDSILLNDRLDTIKSGARIEVHARDAFTYVAEPKCHVGLNWWTSFGYAESDSSNILMLKRAAESLISDGTFALDFMNVPGVIHHFKPQVVTHGHSSEHGKVTLVRESQLDVANGFLLKDWIYFLENGDRIEHQTKVRMYLPHEIHHLFEKAGFTNINLYGDLDGSKLTLNSPRCITTGTKR